ncbi:unnamed protein product, partial [Symbiodinium sp. KB8]
DDLYTLDFVEVDGVVVFRNGSLVSGSSGVDPSSGLIYSQPVLAAGEEVSVRWGLKLTPNIEVGAPITTNMSMTYNSGPNGSGRQYSVAPHEIVPQATIPTTTPDVGVRMRPA